MTPYLTVTGVAKLIEFLQNVFDATVVEQMTRADGTLGHCEVRIGDSIVSCGNTWWVATHKEDVSAEELQRRARQKG